MSNDIFSDMKVHARFIPQISCILLGGGGLYQSSSTIKKISNFGFLPFLFFVNMEPNFYFLFFFFFLGVVNVVL